jgi:HEAT repeat protein
MEYRTMISRPKKQNVSIQQVVAALLDDQTVFPAAYLHHLSDLEGSDMETLRSIWPQVSAQRRINLMGDLEDLTETDTLVSFDNVSQMALKDSEPRVRTIAIRLQWENKDPRLAPLLMDMLRSDPDDNVRAAAAAALGSFVYLGEVEEIPEELHRQIEDHLLQVHTGQEAPLVRRRALEALGFSGRKEVPALIREAYNSEATEWVGSALYAMGRSADSSWAAEINRMLNHRITSVQIEAIRAAGELELSSSRHILLKILDDDMQDEEVRAAAIWSLSQIGGEEVREALESILEESEDEEEIEILEKALDNLSFTEDTGLYGLFDFLGDTAEVDDYMNGLEGATGQPDSEEEDDSSPGDSRRRGNPGRRP